MMNQDDYMADDLEGEAPCEFCGELYPLVLLIEHQSIHLTGGDDYSYLDQLINQDEVAQNIIAEDLGLNKTEAIAEQNQQSADKKEPEIVFEQKQLSAAINQIRLTLANTNEGNAAQNSDSSKTKTDESSKTEQKRSSTETKAQADNATTEQKQSVLFSRTLKDIKKFPEQKGKEYTTEKGEKLLVYGDDIDPDKELENEKPAYKMPDNPLLNSVSKNEDIEDISNLSDDDCSESLEEFWKRARDFLKRNRTRNEC